MAVLTVSSKGQIVLPAALRRRLGLGAGAKVELVEEQDELRLRVIRDIRTGDISGLAGLIQARARGAPRRLEDFDAALTLRRGKGDAA